MKEQSHFHTVFTASPYLKTHTVFQVVESLILVSNLAPIFRRGPPSNHNKRVFCNHKSIIITNTLESNFNNYIPRMVLKAILGPLN